MIYIHLDEENYLKNQIVFQNQLLIMILESFNFAGIVRFYNICEYKNINSIKRIKCIDRINIYTVFLNPTPYFSLEIVHFSMRNSESKTNDFKMKSSKIERESA